MRIVYLLLIFLLPLPLLSQGLIGKNKFYVKKWLQKEAKKQDSIQIIISDRDSLIYYSSHDGKFSNTDFIYGFDKVNKCRSQKVIASCDSCFEKYLRQALERKKYGWRKINENQYISGYKYFMMLETSPEKNDYSYQILRTTWTRQSYKLITEN